MDGELSPGETGIDCGGRECASCALGVGCLEDIDCESGSCVELLVLDAAYCYPTHLFSAVYGDPAAQEIVDVALKANGNVVITGWFEGAIDFGDGALSSQGDSDVFIAELDATGAGWSRSLHGPSFQQPVAVAITDERPLVAGFANQSIDFGSGALPVAGSNDVFVAALADGGAPSWANLYGSPSLDIVSSLAVAGDGTIAVVGSFLDTTDLGLGPLVSAGDHDAYVAKLDGDGVPLSAMRYGDAQWNGLRAVAFDSQGDILVLGKSAGTIDFGTGPLSAPGFSAFLHVSKLDGDTLAPLWSRVVPLVLAGGGAKLAVDADDNIILAGEFYGEANFGLGLITGEAVGYVVKLNGQSGDTSWVRHFGGPNPGARVHDLAIRDSDIFIASSGDAGAAFGQANLTPFALLRFDADGELVLGLPMYVHRLDVRGSTLAVAANVLGVVDFGGGWLISNDGSEKDVVIALLELP